ncbi:MAG: FtsX-like permease family protein [Erysipelotrichaceae bacterium]
MYFKLSFRNMKRSIADYGIYFVTLMLAVCLFYVFNSITAQQVMLDLSNAQAEMLGYLDNLMSLASLFVSLIFCILCLFANQFLIKRRKKEFGLYMSMGMSKFGVSKLLVIESAMVGLLSLVVGIGVGALLSQAMTLFNAALFDTTIVQYQFIFSGVAALKTVLFFGLVFAFVMVLNVITVSKYTLISLLTSAQKPQKQQKMNHKAQLGFTLLGLVVLVLGYQQLLTINLANGFNDIIVGSVLLLVGTLLFYLYGVNVVLHWIQTRKEFYYTSLRMFNTTQLKAKINTALTAIITISYMLFFTIAMLSNSMSYKNTVENELALVAPFDHSVSIYHYEHPATYEIEDVIAALELDFAQNEWTDTNIYNAGLDLSSLLGQYAQGTIKQDLSNGFYYNAYVISYSDYIALMEQQGIKPQVLTGNETLILSNMNEAQDTLKAMLAQEQTIVIDGQTYNFKEEGYQLAAIETENIGRLLAAFVLPDTAAANLTQARTILNFNYQNQNQVNDAKDVAYLQNLDRDSIIDNNYYAVDGVSKSVVYHETMGYTINFLYIGIYLGIVFLIASGSVLGLRLLSDASDEQERYQMLKRLGATDSMISRSVRTQVLSYFAIPLLLAIPSSIVVSMSITKQLASTTYTFSIIPALLSAVVLLLLYGGYFIITYTGYKKIVMK